jgi:transcriptional regulator with XRE-family HTH domain
MVRTPLTPQERARGLALGRALQVARGTRSAAEVAVLAGVSLDTLRKIERGAIATPAFFTVAALARALDLDLTVLAKLSGEDLPAPRRAGARG